MRFVSVRELRENVTGLLRQDIEKRRGRVIVTRRGKPVAAIVPFSAKGEMARILLEEAGTLFRSAGVGKRDVLEALEEVRLKVHGSRRP